MPEIPPRALAALERAQALELTEALVYAALARRERDTRNRATLERIAADEARHAEVLQGLTGRAARPRRATAFFYVAVARLFGLTFGLKLMEKGEEAAQKGYGVLEDRIPALRELRTDEEEHEHALLDMLHDEPLQYAGSVVLGLNDALVELTGALAGLSFAFQNTQLIALSGLVTGIAASFSMAASEFLSTRAEGGENAGKSSLYTGFAYIVTVFLLVTPFLVLADYRVCMAVTLAVAVLIILVFNFYLSVAKDLDFKRRFLEMAGISLGVSALSFGIGILVKRVLGVEL